MSRPRIGGGKITLAADTSVAVNVSRGRGYYISADVDCWVTTSDNNTVINPMTAANATMIRGGQNYGPFGTMGGVDNYVHVAGVGVTGNAWITVL